MACRIKAKRSAPSDIGRSVSNTMVIFSFPKLWNRKCSSSQGSFPLQTFPPRELYQSQWCETPDGRSLMITSKEGAKNTKESTQPGIYKGWIQGIVMPQNTKLKSLVRESKLISYCGTIVDK